MKKNYGAFMYAVRWSRFSLFQVRIEEKELFFVLSEQSSYPHTCQEPPHFLAMNAVPRKNTSKC